jgi:hypothetical protein
MKRALGLAIVLALAATPAVAQKVNIDYAHDYDFDAVRTFQYVDTSDSNHQNPMMADRIQAAIIRELVNGGLEQVDADPDLLVTYHVVAQENTVLHTNTYGYGGYHRGWGRWGMGMGSATTTASTYTEGTLVIDAYDASEKKMVWRGTGTVTVKDDPEKRTKQVDKILGKLGKKWKKIHASKGK